MTQSNQSGLSGADEKRVQDALAPTTEATIPPDRRAKDPVCGSVVDVRTAQFTTNYLDAGGVTKTFYFDSDECKQTFEREPEKYSNLI